MHQELDLVLGVCRRLSEKPMFCWLGSSKNALLLAIHAVNVKAISNENAVVL